jgi:hypothetical protein
MRADRRVLLRSLYAFDFPEDLFTFWDFANRVRPLEPVRALEDLGITLVGPFEVLDGRFDRHTPRLSQYLHWRYHDDPPEFFTALLAGGGLHWGLYLDDPRAAESCVASYFLGEPIEITADGDTLFEAVRLHLEISYRDRLEDRDLGLGSDGAIRALDQLRARLASFATSERPEIGRDYEERYPAASRRQKRVIARTSDSMGIVAPVETYRPLSVKDRSLRQILRRGDDSMLALVGEAQQAVHAGFPATALKLGKDLHAIGGVRCAQYSFELLHSAYLALGRGVLADVLTAHHRNRALPTVDILEMESEATDE